VTAQAVKAGLPGSVLDFDRVADAADGVAQIPDPLAGVIPEL
jgi:hypothetical protein